jgi:ABC-type multidrug transport system fused ATPase/permease subunit
MKKLTNFISPIKFGVKNNIYMLSILSNYSKAYIVVYSITTFIDGIFPLIGLYLPKMLIDMISRGERIENILFLVSAYTAVSLTYFIFTYTIKGKYLQPKSDMLFNHISLLLKTKVANLDMRYLEDPQYHDLLEKASKVSQGEGTNVIHNIFSLISSIITLISLSFIVFRINIWVMAIAIVVVIFNAVLNAKTKQVEVKIYNELAPNRRQIGYNIGILGDTKYYKEVRLFNLQTWIAKKAEDVIRNMFIHLKKSIWKMHKYALVGSICNVLQEALLFVLLGIQTLKKIITFGDFVLYINSISKYSEQLNKIIWSLIQINSSGQYIDYFRKFLGIENNIITDKGERLSKQTRYSIEFSDVSFHYPGNDKLALNSISVAFKTGMKYAVVGPNGAGKTTLVKLLLRLYDPLHGKITINDKDITELNYADYQSNYGVVFQDYQAYAYTVADNIVLNSAYDENKLKKVLKEVGLEKKIMGLKNGINTNLQKIFDAEGIEFSGGELQKLAIARCLYHDSNIVVLDEPSAALDPYAEKEIYENIMKLRSDSTLIFITHRLTSVKKADVILYMEDGKIVESGGHDELMKLDGKYHNLFITQAEEYL